MGRKRVPWIDGEEWSAVKSNLLSSNVEDNIKAYETLLVWKARSLNLPANIECTLAVVEAIIKKHTKRKLSGIATTILEDEVDLQTRFALAVVRFINFTSHTNTPNVTSLYTIAQRKNIPDWIVNLRHDIAHSSSLPPLEILESGLLIAKQWLIENYWENPLMDSSTFENGEESQKPLQISSATLVVSTAVKSWVACTIRSKDRSDDVLCPHLSELKKLLKKSKWKNKPSAKSTVEIINSEIQRLRMGKRSMIRLTLLSNRILQLIQTISYKKKNSGMILQAMKDVDFLKYSGSGIFSWAPLLQILHSEDSLKGLIEHLIDQLSLSPESNVQNAVKWLQALIEPLENLNKNGKRLGNGNEKGTKKALWLELEPPSLPELQLEKLRPHLIENSPGVDRQIILRYMRFVKGSLIPEQWSLMNELLELYDGDEGRGNCETLENEPYSVDALPIVEDHTEMMEEQTPWKLASNFDPEKWYRCPIGRLPWQDISPVLKLSNSWI